jgi:hypothetical protein
MMKKFIMIIGTAAILALAGNVVLAEQQGNPFDAVWNAVASLQEQISVIAQKNKQLHLYDANGQHIGVVVDHGPVEGAEFRMIPGYMVYEPTLGVYLIVEEYINRISPSLVMRGNGGGMRNVSVLFEEPNCTGNAYAHLPRIGLQEAIKMDEPGNPRYFRGTDDGGGVRPWTSAFSGSCFNVPQPIDTTVFLLEEITLPINEPLAWPPITKLE